MGNVNSHEIYQVRRGSEAGSKMLIRLAISWVDPNVAMDPYCDKPWAL
jgi:hypothetical protein